MKNESYEASLELRKVYRTLRDSRAAREGLLRVIDESEEDYLYPADFFVPIHVPKEATPVFTAVPV